MPLNEFISSIINIDAELYSILCGWTVSDMDTSSFNPGTFLNYDLGFYVEEDDDNYYGQFKILR